MSINELVQENKKWLRLRCNNLTVDGDIIPTEAYGGSRLTYIGDGNAKFQSPNNQNTTTGDSFIVAPQTITVEIAHFVLNNNTDISETNFNLTSPTEITCNNAGNYLVTWSVGFVDQNLPTNSGIEVYLVKAGIILVYGFVAYPIITTLSGINSGYSTVGSMIMSVNNGDVISIGYKKSPSTTDVFTVDNRQQYNLLNLIKI